MSMVHCMVGGGGGIKDAFAVIAVTYPTGSHCECTNGTKTLTAKDTSGEYLFLIPEAGTWTVRAYDRSTYEGSTNKDSDSRNIATRNQMENIKLSFRLPSAYQEVEYIQGTGTQYCYSGFTPDGNSRVKIVGKELQILESRLYGSSVTAQKYFRTIIDAEGRLRADYPSYTNPSVAFTASQTNNGFTLDHNKGHVTFLYNNGQTVLTLTSQSTASLPGLPELAFFHAKSESGFASTVGSKYKLISAEAYDNGILTHSYIPCYRKADNVAGLWDSLGENFYTNIGTGTFGVGGDIT